MITFLVSVLLVAQCSASTLYFQPTHAQAVVCPDGKSQCLDKNTCCKLPNGEYGCCPLPEAVCCSDHLHCCPHGTTCDVSHSKCNSGDFSMPWMEKTAAIRVGDVVCPDGQSHCPDGNTCCKLTTGQWGCCPLPQAVCCSDQIHCCPNGTTCDVSHGRCVNGDFTTPMVKKTLAFHVGSILCPDGQSQCPDGETCCKLSTGQWGCCPLPKAVCCSDGLHCCPQGATCDVSHGKCNRGDLSFPWVEKTLAISPLPKAESVVCPDGKSECPDGNTCCKLVSGQYGCCPLPKAVCCSDHLHCCPSGTTCDVAHGKCNQGELIFPWVEKTPAKQVEAVICPDGSQCPDGNTCCILSSGHYGCCPLPNAVCCSDRLHCCPSGTTCDVSHGKCLQGDLSFPWVEKTQAKQVEAVNCPDGSQCPDGNTCCTLPSGEYGCCPLPNAVCCSDHLHCCPSGTTCDVSHGKCLQGDLSFPWVEKTPAKQAEAVICPDGSQCPDGNTCCTLPSGEYGCCPLPNAVCCSDHLHCCPSGTTCDVSHGKCLQGDLSFPWVEKTPAKQVEAVICPDGSQCPDGNTCCTLPSGQYGCCPLPNAVCCSDHLHCCPSGTTCDVSQGKCLQGDLSLPWRKRRQPNNQVGDVNCSKGQSCPDGNTCCKTLSGLFGCCPFPNAVCCPDQQHCCPQGFTCDLVQTKCIMGNGVTVPLAKKTPAEALVKDVICSGGKQKCPSETTCCELKSGLYGCCPLPDAVCCGDGEHCCPSGYTCNVAEARCYKDSVLAIPWIQKVPALKELVTCSDGKTKCPAKNTCCQMANLQWACCPIEEAHCCEDKLHCCPVYLKCDIPSGKCVNRALSIPWMEKTPGLMNYVNSVICSDGSQCPDGNTCCKLSTGQYGCCPLPSAVCCQDGLHCCPNGYKCNTSQGTCERADSVPMAVCCGDGKHCCPPGYKCNVLGQCFNGSVLAIPWIQKVPALKEIVTCPDGKTKCPAKNTCCRKANHQWACCPIETAMCCEDKIHCCPDYMVCDIPSGKCVRESLSIPWMEKTPGLVNYVNSVICSDGSQCPDGNTCCKLSTGQYGCCPLPSAVCCQDGLHCCPNGYKCNTSQGTCERADSVPMVTFL
ncbi:multiple epidermal growth factor-like domains protein 6 [Ptychodera flava]|uniref:multiple epidermal growth factor-like domains protein 6 n=1 Tax=Ptychodera flava TaxID=63121 RepID=UPI003969BF5D